MKFKNKDNEPQLREQCCISQHRFQTEKQANVLNSLNVLALTMKAGQKFKSKLISRNQIYFYWKLG